MDIMLKEWAVAVFLSLLDADPFAKIDPESPAIPAK
jgi:hypothetical protein